MQKIAPAWKWVFLLLLATVAAVLAFHFDEAARRWVVEHSNRTARGNVMNHQLFTDTPAAACERSLSSAFARS